MPYQSGATRFRERFESALQAYQKTTGLVLAEHPLAVQVQSCHCVESITKLLTNEARAFSSFSNLQGSDSVIKSIEGVVSILSTISATSLGEAVGLVRQKCDERIQILNDVFLAIPTSECGYCWPCNPSCSMCRSPIPMWISL
jgi:hypothetical protein